MSTTDENQVRLQPEATPRHVHATAVPMDSPGPRRRGRYAAVQIDDLLHRWEKSGLSAAAFSRESGVKSATLKRWRQQRHGSDLPTLRRMVLDAPETCDASSADGQLVVSNATGCHIVVRSDCSEALLQRIVRVLSCST